MIAARDPQEFIPSGRQQLRRHPGPSDLHAVKDAEIVSHDVLLDRFKKVSINEPIQSEWWKLRKAPVCYYKNKSSRNVKTETVTNASPCTNSTKNNEEIDNSPTGKCHEPVQHKAIKRLSDLSGSKRRLSDNDLMSDSYRINYNKTFIKHDYLKCKHTELIEEELYVNDNVVIWSKGSVPSGESLQYNSSRKIISTYTSFYPVKFANWCTFYCERPTFENFPPDNKLDQPSGSPLPSICIIDTQNIQVFTEDNEDFITTLPFQVAGMWTTKFGILLEKHMDSKSELKTNEEELLPTIFSMAHPLDDTAPVAIRQGSLRLLDDQSLNIVFTSEKPSICMLYDKHTGQHSVYQIRKIRKDEWLEIRNKLMSPAPTLGSMSHKLRNRLSAWDFQKGVISNFSSPCSSRPASAASTHSNQQSKSHSVMATISRCQSPTPSALFVSNPWLQKSFRCHSSLRSTSGNFSINSNFTNLEGVDNLCHLNPTLCFDHIWTDNFTSQLDVGPASKVFLIDDLIERWYLCYLIPSRSQLSIVQVDFSNQNFVTFGLLTSISAQDAVPISHLHLIALLEHDGNIVLYSGLTIVGKLHMGGVLAQYTPSPCVMRSLPQFNSPFPRRSTLLPHSTPSAKPQFDHFLSPVTPVLGDNFNLNVPLVLDSFKFNDSLKVRLCGLRDPVEDKITLHYSDGTFYRISLPTLASSTLVENCINILRLTLTREAAITLLTRWYAARNAPGSVDLNLNQEWLIFTSLIFELLGYEGDQSCELPFDAQGTPSNSAKRQRSCTMGTDLDWNIFLGNDYHKESGEYLSKILRSNDPLPTNTYSSSKIYPREVNVNSILFPSIRIIHYTLHLFYEDLKLDTTRSEELFLLAQFLSKISSNLKLLEYVKHYWKDFPDLYSLNKSNTYLIPSNNFKNIICWPVMSEKAESIIEYIYKLILEDTNLPPYPYIDNVNNRSKTLVQICGTLIKGLRNPNIEVNPNKLVKQALPFNTGMLNTDSVSKTEIDNSNVYEKVVILMTKMGITTRYLDSFPAGVSILLYSALWECRENPPTDWPAEAYNLLQRPDLAAQAQLTEKIETDTKSEFLLGNRLSNSLPKIKQMDDIDQEDGMDDIDGGLLKMRFYQDHRVLEVRRLLQSSKPVTINLVQRPDVSDHDFIEEQEKHLYSICARTMALPIGRGIFTLRTATPVITEPLSSPKLCLTGKVPPRNVTIELSHIDYPQNMQYWPLFHNGVANGLRISPDAQNIDTTWITFNQPKNSIETNMEHAGFLMALGLNGHLTNLSILNTYDYLSKCNEMTSVGILLGLSAALRGTQNTMVTKILSIHIEALLPPTSMELDVPQNLQVAALLGIGLLYQRSAHRHITEILLTEIGRPPGPEMENSVDRESYSLAAGLALGLVTLKHGGKSSGLADLNVPDTLHYFMVGGNKRPLTGSQKEKYKVPSFQIREGPSVNLDVTSPGATIALGLMYLGTGNKAVADWMTPPGTQYLLDFIRPDFLMLRIMAKGLIMWETVNPTKQWIYSQVPESIRPFCLVKPSSFSSYIDYEAMNQAYCNIIAGACFTVGLKYAGSSNFEAFETLLYFLHLFISLTGKSIAELAGKPTIETCLNLILVSAAMIMAGTGNLDLLRIIRHLRRRIGLASSAVVTYGSHLAIHMALGLLFVGGGRYTLSNSPENVAALICAFYPKFPTHSGDNRYHLQAFRHLYVLAVEPRLIIPKDIVTGRMCYANIGLTYLDGTQICLQGPWLIPDLNTLQKVSIQDDRYWPVVFERNRNWDQLIKLLKASGFIEVKQRAGCLSYIEDKSGYRSLSARTLTHSKTVPWDPPSKAITSFSSDKTVHFFCDNVLMSDPNINSSTSEVSLLKLYTKATYDCIIRDKEIVLRNYLSLIKVVDNLTSISNTLQLWQFKLLCALVLKNPLLVDNLIDAEVVLSLYKKTSLVLKNWESELDSHLKSYVWGNDENSLCLAKVKKLANYVQFYDIPHNLNNELGNCDVRNVNFLSLMQCLKSKNLPAETVLKIAQILNVQM